MPCRCLHRLPITMHDQGRMHHFYRISRDREHSQSSPSKNHHCWSSAHPRTQEIHTHLSKWHPLLLANRPLTYLASFDIFVDTERCAHGRCRPCCCQSISRDCAAWPFHRVAATAAASLTVSRNCWPMPLPHRPCCLSGCMRAARSSWRCAFYSAGSQAAGPSCWLLAS